MDSTPARDPRIAQLTLSLGTSRLAYEGLDLSRRRAIVLDALEQWGPATADELAAVMGLDHNLVAPRLTELRQAGAVYDTGQRRVTRVQASGVGDERPGRCWR